MTKGKLWAAVAKRNGQSQEQELVNAELRGGEVLERMDVVWEEYTWRFWYGSVSQFGFLFFSCVSCTA